MMKTKFLCMIFLALLMACESSSEGESNPYDKPHDPNKAVVVEDI